MKAKTVTRKKQQPVKTRVEKRTKAERAFSRFAKEFNRYAGSLGWNILVVGNPRIEQPIGSAPFTYEFVLRFTGGKKK